MKLKVLLGVGAVTVAAIATIAAEGYAKKMTPEEAEKAAEIINVVRKVVGMVSEVVEQALDNKE